MSGSRFPSKRAAESLPNGTELADRVTASRFTDWYRKRQIRENICNGTPYFNGPAPIQSPTRHSPSQLLQCHRQIAYRQLNAPEENDDPTGIFWIGSKFEEEVALPFLRDAVTESDTFVCNSLWVDFEVTLEPDSHSLHIKGETDRNYSQHGKLVLYALTLFNECGETPARTREVVNKYRQVARSEGVSPVSERSVRDYLGELAQLGIASSEEHNRGKGGGKYNEHRLEQSVSAVRGGLSTLLDSA